MAVRVLKDLEVAADVVERLPFLGLHASGRHGARTAPVAVIEVVSHQKDQKSVPTLSRAGKGQGEGSAGSEC